MFLQRVIADVLSQMHNTPAHHLLFVVPSKRTIIFLKKYYAQAAMGQVGFAPEFISIENFLEKVSGYQILPELPLLLEFYHTYSQCKKANNQEPDSLDDFLQWAPTILADFNDIDQYLISSNKLFPHLEAIKEVENLHWKSEPMSEMQKKYLEFWNSLEEYYNAFCLKMEEQKEGYQGFVSKKAVEHLQKYILENKHIKHIFVGFNALSKAEEELIERILWEMPSCEIYWDTDQHLLEQGHQAGYFVKDYRKNWKKYKNNEPFKWLHKDFSAPKEIIISGVPQESNQAHLLAEIIQHTPKEQLLQTAIVLADEGLLIPILQSFDQEKLKEQGIPLNITMGYPLKNTLFSGMFGAYFKLYTQGKWYYKEVINLLMQPTIKLLFSKNYTEKTIEYIYQKNYNYLSESVLQLFAKDEDLALAQTIFLQEKKPNANILLENCLKLIEILKNNYEKDSEKNALELEYLYRFYQLFNQIQELQNKYGFITSGKSLYNLYQQLLLKQSLDFKGEPLEGLQLMGLMESRNLDFEYLIVTSLNEGVLPKGGLGHSFLPYDLRAHLKLPTYEKKDAIFAYHFFRLLQRAKHIHLMYNAEDASGKTTEKSRFIEQLLSFEGQKPFEKIKLTQRLILPKVQALGAEKITIAKTPYVMEKLRERANGKGFSPTALTTYIRNPIDFYLQIIHGVKEDETIEESISPRNFGTILHQVLENIYSTIGTPMSKEVFPRKITKSNVSDISKEKIAQEVEKEFAKMNNESSIVGRNYLIINILKDYIERFLALNAQEMEQHQEVILLYLEEELSGEVKLNNQSIRLNGVADRIEKRDDTLYIIDYKTGNMKPTDVKLDEQKWEKLTTDFKHSKAFQLLMYAYLIQKKKNFPQQRLIAGNYCFKNLQAFMPFTQKENKQTLISTEILEKFETKLQELLTEIFDEKIPFVSKEE